MKTIEFKEFARFLSGDGYSKKEIVHSFCAVKRMTKKTRGWVFQWMATGAYPNEKIEGVSAQFLIEELGYKPINAFIVLDWLMIDPNAAKYFVLQMPTDLPDAQVAKEEMIAFLESKNIVLSDDADECQIPDITI